MRQKAEYDEKSNPNPGREKSNRTLDTAYIERAENIPLDEQKLVKPQLQKEYITVTSSQIFY